MFDKIKNDSKMKNIFMFFLIGVYIFLITFTNTAWYALNEGTKFYTILKMARYICYAMFAVAIFIKIIKNNYSKEMLFFYILLVIISGVTVVTGKDKFLFFTVLFLGAIYGISSQKLFKCSLIVQGCLLIITIICAFMGLADNSILDTQRARYSLGFLWSSLAPILYLFVAMLYIYARKSKMTWIECIALEIINIFLYKYTNTKMSFIVLTLVLFVLLIVKLSSGFRQILKNIIYKYKKFVIAVPVICAFISCLLPLYNQQSTLWIKLNNILSGRLWQCKNAIVRYGFSLLGVHIDVEGFSVANHGISDTTYFIDMGYLRIAMEYGIIILLLMVMMYVYILLKAYKKRDIYMVSIIIVISFFCINDIFLLHSFNIFIAYIFCDEDIFKDIPLLQKLSKPIGVVVNKINSVFVKKEQ